MSNTQPQSRSKKMNIPMGMDTLVLSVYLHIKTVRERLIYRFGCADFRAIGL